MSVAQILVAEAIADNGLELLRKAGHHVDVRLQLAPDELLVAMRDVNALIVRSATKVTSAVLAAAPQLVVVGRAGIGLDNIDVPAATRQGVLVVNAPQSNVVSAAEQAIALLLASARNIPQAHASLKSGIWDRARWEGVELYGKTMGILGLGRVGALVAQRCAAFGMRMIAHDPYISTERAQTMDVELTSLADCMCRSDFLSIHLPLNAETTGLIDSEMLALARPHLKIINTARGGIIDEVALHNALSSGQIGGAALDVFAAEPCTDSPLFQLDNVVVTPHLGASTREAQDKASDTIAEMVQLALAGEFVPFAVNIDAAEASATVQPFLPLAERMGRLMAGLCRGAPATLEIAFAGQIAEYDTRILQLSVLKGLLAAVTAEPVTFVNASMLATDLGLVVSDWKTAASDDYRNKITLRSSCGHSLAGTLAGLRMEPRIVMVDDHDVEVPPSRHLLVVRNDDRPGMIGVVGTTVGNHGVNISNMALGRTKGGGSALMVLDTDGAVPQLAINELRLIPGISGVDPIDENLI